MVSHVACAYGKDCYRLRYTFTLREGLRWHDGLPVTAADVVASLQR